MAGDDSPAPSLSRATIQCVFILADFLEWLYNLESVSFNGERPLHYKSVKVAARVIIGHPVNVNALVMLLMTFHCTISFKIDWGLVMNLRNEYKQNDIKEEWCKKMSHSLSTSKPTAPCNLLHSVHRFLRGTSRCKMKEKQLVRFHFFLSKRGCCVSHAAIHTSDSRLATNRLPFPKRLANSGGMYGGYRNQLDSNPLDRNLCPTLCHS
jgi:hypothetical protein